jgi:hypothetical protein
MLHRRQVLLRGCAMMAGTALIGTTTGAGPAVANDASGALRFDVRRNGSEIGYHVLSFRQDGPRLTVDIDVDLRVSFAFITAYRYKHRNREQWEGGRLLGFKSSTNDNGTRHEVEAGLEGDELVIVGSQGQISGPANMLPTTYWHRNFMTRERWIDTQKGRIVAGAVAGHGIDPIEAAGRTVEASRYRISGDLDVDLWYHDERWVKLAFDASDGSRIDYRLTDAAAYDFLSFVPGEPTSA